MSEEAVEPIDDVVVPATFGEPVETQGLVVRYAEMTPERAAQLLTKNRHHRDTKPKLVKRYAERMKTDAWMLNGKTIVIDREGWLMGGQHRLQACVKSGKPFPTLVVWGVDPAVLQQESE